jgi:hypothetical protein
LGTRLSENSPTWALHGDAGQAGKHAGDGLDWRTSALVDWAGRSSASVWSSRRCGWGRWWPGRGIDSEVPAEKGADGGSVDRCLPVAVDGSGRLVALTRSPWGCQLNQMEVGGIGR